MAWLHYSRCGIDVTVSLATYKTRQNKTITPHYDDTVLHGESRALPEVIMEVVSSALHVRGGRCAALWVGLTTFTDCHFLLLNGPKEQMLDLISKTDYR